MKAVFHGSWNNFSCESLILCYGHLSKPAINLSQTEVRAQWNQEGNGAWRCCLQSYKLRWWDWMLSALKGTWQGWLQARHWDGLRDMSLLGQAFSAPDEISLMRHISCPQSWPLSPECHVSVTGSCWIWSSAVPGSISLEAGYCLSASWFFRRLILQTPAELLPKDFHLREKEMLCTPVLKDCWFLGHQSQVT